MGHNLKCIGKGTFATVYKLNSKQVLIKSDDFTKECMAMSWFVKSRLFPPMKDTNTQGEYISTYYPKVRSLKESLTPKHYAYYKELRDIYRKYQKPNYSTLYREFSRIDNRYLRLTMLDALDCFANYGQDICFEISPRNVAVTSTGKLILLDCFFILSQLRKKNHDYIRK